MTCMCGDTQCPSCGAAQGTLESGDTKVFIPEWGLPQENLIQNSDLPLIRELVALRERCYKVAYRMSEAASKRLEKGHNEDAAVQYDTAIEIAEAIQRVHLLSPMVCEDCGAEESDYQRDLDLDCKCGGSFV